MASYLVATYKITNMEDYTKYTAAVGPTIISHGGKIVVAGPDSTPIEGTPDPVTIVLEFSIAGLV